MPRPKTLGCSVSPTEVSLSFSLSLCSPFYLKGDRTAQKQPVWLRFPTQTLSCSVCPTLVSLPSPLLRFGRRAQKQLGLPVRLALSRAAAQCYSAESVNPMMTSFILNTAHDTSRELGIPTLTKYGNIQNLTFYAKYLWIIQAGSSAYSFFDLKCKRLSAEL